MILLVSTDESTRSSAITRSSTGKPSVISLAIAAVCSFFKVEKLASVILKSEKLTRRSASETFVLASTLTVPRSGLVVDAPWAE